MRLSVWCGFIPSRLLLPAFQFSCTLSACRLSVCSFAVQSELDEVFTLSVDATLSLSECALHLLHQAPYIKFITTDNGYKPIRLIHGSFSQLVFKTCGLCHFFAHQMRYKRRLSGRISFVYAERKSSILSRII